MGLIKANSATVASSVAFSLADIEQQARAMLLRARAEADQVLAQATREGEALRAAAVKEGRAAGLEQGRKEGHRKGIEAATREGKALALAEQRAKLTELVTALTTAAGRIDSHLKTLDQTATAELVRLALAIARRVTKQSAERDVAIAESNVREAVRLATNKSSLRIAICPAQRAELLAVLPQLKLAWPAIQHVELIDDPALAAGGCRVFTLAGAIDASIDGQLDRIERELRPAAQDGRPCP